MSNALKKVFDCRTSLSNSICYITQTVDRSLNIRWPPPSSTGHHKEGRSLQATFRKDISSFVKVVVQLGNPFVATRLELVALDTQNVMEESVVASHSEIPEVGQTLHAAYVRERLDDSSVPISDIIKRNNMLTFTNRPELRKKTERMSAYNDIT